MSISYDVYSCFRCQYGGSAIVKAGVFQYAAPDGPVDVLRAQVWCRSCSGLAPVESLPTEEPIQAMSRELADMRTCLSVGQEHLEVFAEEGESERNTMLRPELSILT